jgi:hypothetical protein
VDKITGGFIASTIRYSPFHGAVGTRGDYGSTVQLLSLGENSVFSILNYPTRILRLNRREGLVQ